MTCNIMPISPTNDFKTKANNLIWFVFFHKFLQLAKQKLALAIYFPVIDLFRL